MQSNKIFQEPQNKLFAWGSQDFQTSFYSYFLEYLILIYRFSYKNDIGIIIFQELNIPSWS